MNSDPFMTSHAREVDDVEMVLLSLLDNNGALSVPSRVDGFFALMCRVQKVRREKFQHSCACETMCSAPQAIHYLPPHSKCDFCAGSG